MVVRSFTLRYELGYSSYCRIYSIRIDVDDVSFVTHRNAPLFRCCVSLVGRNKLALF